MSKAINYNFLGQYVAAHRPVSITDKNAMHFPNVDHSGSQNPHFPARPAHYLPVQYFEPTWQDWFVLISGKAVALDSNGHLVPAGIYKNTCTLVYTLEDVKAGTRKPDGTLVTAQDVTDGYTLYEHMSNTAVPGGGGGRTPHVTSNNYPIGYAQYSYWRWHGTPTTGAGILIPSRMREYNWSLQHQVSVCTKYVIEVPVIWHEAVTDTINEGQRWHRLDTRPKVSPAIQFAGANAAAVFSTEVASEADVNGTGDYYINYITGMIYMYTQPTGAITVTFYPEYEGDGSQFTHYENFTGAGAQVNDTVVQPGEFVMPTDNGFGDYTVWDGNDPREIIGQVLHIDSNWPNSGLSKVAAPGMIDHIYDAVPSDETQGKNHAMYLTNAYRQMVYINILR